MRGFGPWRPQALRGSWGTRRNQPPTQLKILSKTRKALREKCFQIFTRRDEKCNQLPRCNCEFLLCQKSGETLSSLGVWSCVCTHSWVRGVRALRRAPYKWTTLSVLRSHHGHHNQWTIMSTMNDYSLLLNPNICWDNDYFPPFLNHILLWHRQATSFRIRM